jgi:hypothetical protein
MVVHQQVVFSGARRLIAKAFLSLGWHACGDRIAAARRLCAAIALDLLLLLGGLLLGSSVQAATLNWSTSSCAVNAGGGCTAVGSVIRFSNVLTGANARDALVTIVSSVNGATVTAVPAPAGAGAMFDGGVTANAAGSQTSYILFDISFVNVGGSVVTPVAGPVSISIYDSDGNFSPTGVGIRERVEFVTTPAVYASGSQLVAVAPVAGAATAAVTGVCTSAAEAGCLDGVGDYYRYSGTSTVAAIATTAVFTGQVGTIRLAYGGDTSPGGWYGDDIRHFGFAGSVPEADMVPSAAACLPASVEAGASTVCTLTCTNSGPEQAVSPSCSWTTGFPAGTVYGSGCGSTVSTLAAGASLSCTATFTPTTVGTLTLVGGTGATNDINGGADLTAGNNPRSTTLPVTASADMSAAFTNVPTVVRPGQSLTGLSLTCTNSATAAAAATNAACAPTVDVGTISAVTCTPAVGGSVAAGTNIVCSFNYTAPGTQGGADETTTVVTFTGTTGAANDSVASNNVVTTPATMLDAVNDTTSAAGGLTGQTTNLAANDQYPANSSFSLVSAGTTCAAPTVSSTGTAGYTVPASGSCLVNYQVCAAAPNASTCDNATLTVTAQSADMSAAFTNVPTVVRPGQSLTGLSLTCTNSATAAAAATNAACAPTVDVGTISAVTCTPAVGGSVAAGANIVCSFNYTAPGTQGGADETTTSVTFTGTTGAANDSVASNNIVTTPATMLDAVNDTASAAGGLTGQSSNLASNDQYSAGSTFTLITAGTTCAAPTVSATGTAGYTVPASGSCLINYQVCAAAPNASTCDSATLTVTAQSADMSAAFANVPTVVRPGQSLTGLSLTCTNSATAAAAATSAACAPTVDVGTISAVTCTPAVGGSVAAGANIVCSFNYTAPGTQGGADETTTVVTFTGTTGAANDSVASNNVVTTPATMLDAVNDTASAAGGLAGQSSNLAVNDQYPANSSFSLVSAGTTCAAPTVSSTGTAGYTVPASGSCLINYQVCAAAPNASTCDTATLTVTAQSADMSAAFANVPSVVRPGQSLTGLSLTCTNSATAAAAATSAACAPTVDVGTISAVTCTPAVGGSVAAGANTVCSFNYTAPGTQGGADETTTVVTFTGTTGAANDAVASNNVVTTPATMLDAVNDTASAAGGLTGQSSNLASNDQYPAGSTFTLITAGTTCAAPTVSATGTADYTVPASGSCLVNYQVCAAAPNASTCDNATLTVTAQSADMSAAFANVPSVVRPGQSLTGLSLTCTNSATAAAAATSAACAPTVDVGTISAVTCTPAVGGSVAAGANTVCSFNYTAPGTQGGADETTTTVTFTGTTGAANDAVASNNIVTTPATILDAVNDTASAAGGLTGQTTNLASNDQFPANSSFSLVSAGTTCAAPTVSATGTAGYTVPASGSCLINYQVCAAAPNASTCDSATLTVTAQSADMSAAFANVPTVVRPGQSLTGLSLTCTNSATAAAAATSAACAPTVDVGTISAVTCTPAVGGSVAAGAAIVCSFNYTAPGTQGGADETTTTVTFTGTTGAANDSVASNNIVTTPATMLDAVNDTASAAGGLTGQSSNLASNDQFPSGSTFSLVTAGTTCAAPTVSATGTAGYTVPASGSCLVNYQVCAPAPNATTCDSATLTVTAQSADMSAAFANVPTVVRPGQSLTGLTLTCTNSATAAAAATSATCAPTVDVGSDQRRDLHPGGRRQRGRRRSDRLQLQLHRPGHPGRCR